MQHLTVNAYKLHSCSGDFELDFSHKISKHWQQNTSTHLVYSLSITVSPSLPTRLDLMLDYDTVSIDEDPEGMQGQHGPKRELGDKGELGIKRWPGYLNTLALKALVKIVRLLILGKGSWYSRT